MTFLHRALTISISLMLILATLAYGFQGYACSLNLDQDDWVDRYPAFGHNDLVEADTTYTCLGARGGNGCEPVLVLSTLYGYNWATHQFDVILDRQCATFSFGCNSTGSLGGSIGCVTSCWSQGVWLCLNVGVWNGTCENPVGTVCYGTHSYYFRSQ